MNQNTADTKLVILPISLIPGWENELLLEEVTTFVFSLENRHLYGHITNDDGKSFVVTTNANIYYVFVRMLHVVDVYEDGQYIHIDYTNLKDFLNTYNQLDVPLMGSNLALAEIDPYDHDQNYQKMEFSKGFIHSNCIKLVNEDDIREFERLLLNNNIIMYETVNEIFN